MTQVFNRLTSRYTFPVVMKNCFYIACMGKSLFPLILFIITGVWVRNSWARSFSLASPVFNLSSFYSPVSLITPSSCITYRSPPLRGKMRRGMKQMTVAITFFSYSADHIRYTSNLSQYIAGSSFRLALSIFNVGRSAQKQVNWPAQLLYNTCIVKVSGILNVIST